MPTLPGYNDLTPAPRASQQVIGIEKNPVSDALIQAGSVLGQMEEERKKRQDVAASAKAMTSINDFFRKSTVEKGGFLTLEGEQAIGSTKKAEELFKSKGNEFIAGLPSKSAQFAVQQEYQNQTQTYLNRIAGNEDTNSKKSALVELQSRAESLSNEALTFNKDYASFSENLLKIQDSVFTANKLQGLDDNTAAFESSKAVSKTALLSVKKEISTGSPYYLETYDTVKQFMTEQDIMDAELMIGRYEKAQKKLVEKKDQEEVKSLKQRHKDLQSFLYGGNDPALTETIPYDEMLSVLKSKADADKMYNEQSEALILSSDIDTMYTGSPSQVNQVIDLYKTRIEDPDQNDLKTKSLSKLITARNTAYKMQSDDPVTYVNRYVKSVKEAKDRYQQDQSDQSFKDYLNASVSAQQSIGSPKIGVLEKQEIQEISSLFKNQNMGGAQITNALKEKAFVYGEKWPLAVKQLIDEGGIGPEASIVSSMNLVTQYLPASNLMQASLQKKEIQAIIGDQKARLITNSVNSKLTKYSMAVNNSGIPNGAKHYNNMLTSISTLAQYYVSQGSDQDQAVTKAKFEILDSNYNIIGRVNPTIVPKIYDEKLIESGFEKIRSTLDGKKFQVPQSLYLSGVPGKLGEKIRQEEYINRIKESGFFVVSSDESGAYLATQTDGPVIGEDGKRLFFSFEEIQKLGVDDFIPDSQRMKEVSSIPFQGM